MKVKTILAALCALALTAVLSVVALQHSQHSATPAASVATKTFQVRGSVRTVDISNNVVRITHEEIPNYMPAMTMPFTVKDAALLYGLSAGDNVQFELVVTADDSWVAHIEKISSDPALEPATGDNANTLQEREDQRVHIGETVPDFKLTNQDGRKMALSDFRGQAVVLTFIYTRCPLPNFCPLMSKNFADLEQRLNEEFPGKYHLLSVTMDPDFDTPAVLKEYASHYDASPADWSFATGTAEEIQFVARLTGLYYATENGLISHDLRAALIGPDGRLVHLWKSNVWTPYEVQRMVRETLTGDKDFAAK